MKIQIFTKFFAFSIALVFCTTIVCAYELTFEPYCKIEYYDSSRSSNASHICEKIGEVYDYLLDLVPQQIMEEAKVHYSNELCTTWPVKENNCYKSGSDWIWVKYGIDDDYDFLHEYSHFVSDKVYGPLDRPSYYFDEAWCTTFPQMIINDFSEFESDVVTYDNIVDYYTSTGVLYDISDGDSIYDEGDDDSLNSKFNLFWLVFFNKEPENICEFFTDWVKLGDKYPELAQNTNKLYEVYASHGLIKACPKVDDYTKEYYKSTIDLMPDEEPSQKTNRPEGPVNSWPYSDHDLGRTAYTTLRGDITSSVGMDNWGWSLVGDYGLYDNALIANVDDDPNQEILVTSQTSDSEGRAYVLDVATKDGRTTGYRPQWRKTFSNRLSEPASVWDIDNDNTPEMVFGDNGVGNEPSCIYAYNADTGHREWRYCVGQEEGYFGRLGNTAIAGLFVNLFEVNCA